MHLAVLREIFRRKDQIGLKQKEQKKREENAEKSICHKMFIIKINS